MVLISFIIFAGRIKVPNQEAWFPCSALQVCNDSPHALKLFFALSALCGRKAGGKVRCHNPKRGCLKNKNSTADLLRPLERDKVGWAHRGVFRGKEKTALRRVGVRSDARIKVGIFPFQFFEEIKRGAEGDLLQQQKIGKRPLSPPPLFFQSCDPNKQLKFGHDILHAMGFDKKSSRLDESVHPFCCGLHPKDVRMTTRLESDSLMSNIFSVLHEGGHALYNQGLPESEFGSPLGEQISLGIDESQSRWWETLIGHSLPFWTHFYPRLQKLFPDNLGAVSLDDFYRAINRVHPSFIRVDADEVTYSLHIILRFELEKALIEGSLPVKEVPDAWNAKMKEYLGITPHTLSEGCLQDIHWSSGGIGYFPTYTLGNLYAAQFFTAFEKAHPRWKEQLAHGELGFIAAWLKENIHRHGREFTSTELVERVTKLPLSEAPFINYLTTKYLP